MLDWSLSSLSDAIELQRGFDLPEALRRPGSVPVVASASIVGWHDEAKVAGPGVVIGRSGSIGGGQWIKGDYWPLNTTLWVKDFKENDRRFIYYLLRSIDFSPFNAGSGVPTLNRNHLNSVQVLMPSVAEQRAIAGVLGALDDKIESNRRLVQLLRQTAQAVVASAVVNVETVPLQSVATVQRGFGYKSTGFVDVGVPMISMGSSGVRGWLNRKKIRQYEPTVKDKYKVRAGQVLVVNVDLTWKLDVLGWPLVVPPELDGAVISNDVFGLECDVSRPWLSWVVWAELQTPRARAVIEGGAKGTTVASIGVDTLSSVRIPLPDDNVGTALGTEVSELVNRAWHAERESESLTQTRDLVLPHLLSGRLSVREAEKVVEEVV